MLVGSQPLPRVDVLHFICSCCSRHSFLTPQRPLTTHLAVQCLTFPVWPLQLLNSLVSAFLFLRFDHSWRINNATLLPSGPRDGTTPAILTLRGLQLEIGILSHSHMTVPHRNVSPGH